MNNETKMSDVKITAKLVGYDKYFPEDEEERNIYKVTVSRGGKRISFRFGDSIYNTQQGIELQRDAILSTIESEYHCPETFEDFCDEVGCDVDSRRAFTTFKNLKKQSEKLQKIFTEEEIESLRQKYEENDQ